MFDKLPCTVVMRAIAWVFDSASALSSRYNLCSSSRRHVTINLRDPTGHRIGISYGGEGVLTIEFPMLLGICEYYCFQTYFLFADTFFRLQLGVPQGGSLSDPLSKSAFTANTNGLLLSLTYNDFRRLESFAHAI
jgi:hypothetical protein